MAERAIQTFKHHFVLILSGVNDSFPLSLWCHLVRPVEITVNLLRQSNVAPKVSAYAHVHGQHDYMRQPFAPLGCAFMAHDKPKNRRMWDVYADKGFNIGTAMEHHRCFHVYIMKKRATRVSDRVFFKHQYITNPQITPETLVIKAAAELTNVLKGTVSRVVEMVEALQKVSGLFTKIAAAKAATTRAREQQTYPMSRQRVAVPRVCNKRPTQTEPVPKEPIAPTKADCCAGLVEGSVHIVDKTTLTMRPTKQAVEARLQVFEEVTPHQEKYGTPNTRPNYITQEENA
jgi:hypothetical protein